MRVWGLASIVVLGFAAAATAEPLDFKYVAVEAKWIVHVDVDAMRAATLPQEIFKKVVAAHKDVEDHLAKLQKETGMDLRKDLHSVTLAGPKLGDKMAILVVHADVDQKMLQEKVKKAPDFKSETYGSYELYSFTKKEHGHSVPVTGTFWKPNVMVFGPSPEAVKLVVDAMDGKRATLAGTTSALTAAIPAGATVVARGVEIGDSSLPFKSPLVKEMDSLSLTTGESNGESFVAAKLVTKSAEVAQQISKVMEGARAMGLLRFNDDADAQKIINRWNVTVTDKTVEVAFRAPASDVLTHLEKVVKHMAEMHKHFKHGEKKK